MIGDHYTIIIPLCPYCKRDATLTDSVILYGRDYGMIWLCKKCDARVGCHKGTTKPLGSLADYDLRWKRMLAHEAFDALWKTKQKTRNEVYRWLAGQLGINVKHCHIGGFDIDMCDKVIRLCKGDFKN
mgnify:CR=1 FL=1